MGWRLVLYPQWIHILLLMGVYFWCNAWNSSATGDRSVGVFELVCGFAFALATAIAVGSVTLASTDGGANFIIAAGPIVGVFMYEVSDAAFRATFYREKAAQIYHWPMLPTWWAYFRGNLRGGLLGSLFRTAIGLTIVVVGLRMPIIQQLSSPGLALLTILVIAQSLNFLRMGLGDAKRLRESHESWSEAYQRSGVAKVGMAMLSVIFWAGACLMIGAGNRIIGL
jgi:hypothetical protein